MPTSLRTKLTALLIGDFEQPEFRNAPQAFGGDAWVFSSATVDAPLAKPEASDLWPDLIVLAQARPGEFAYSEVDRLRARWPLARIVGLLGPWCEGEARTGRPWPGVERVYWYHWPAQCARALSQWRAGQCPSWGLPLTADDEDRFWLNSLHPLPRRQGLVAIAARHGETFEALSDACVDCGYATAWQRPNRPLTVRGASVALWDGGDLDAAEETQLRRLTRDLAGVPVVALLDFPRVTTEARAVAAGAVAILAKPFLVDDLLWQIDRAVSQPAQVSRPAAA